MRARTPLTLQMSAELMLASLVTARLTALVGWSYTSTWMYAEHKPTSTSAFYDVMARRLLAWHSVRTSTCE